MKKTTFIAVVMLFAAAVAYAKPGQDQGPTNIDWLLMKQGERMALVTKLVTHLQSKGIPLSAPPARYADLITGVAEDPKLKKEVPVSNILMSIAYAKEPAVRTILDAAKAKAKARAKQQAAAAPAVPGDQY